MDLHFLNLLSLQGLVIAAAVSLVAGIWAMLREHKRASDHALALLLVSVALWVLAFVLWRSAAQATVARFWLRSLYLIGSVVPAAFFLFTLGNVMRHTMRAWIEWVVFLPNALAYVVIFHTDAVLDQSPVAAISVAGSGLFVLAFHFFLLSVAGLVLLLAAVRRKTLPPPGHSILFTLGGILTFAPMGLLLYHVLPFTGGTPLIALPFLVLSGTFLVGFAALRRGAKVDQSSFGIGLLLFMVLFVFSTDCISSATDEGEFALRISITVLLVIFGTMMLRVHMRELGRLVRIEEMYGVLAKMNAKLIEADRVKTKFVAFASHQLRAPIGGIRGYLDMLHNGDFGKLTPQQVDIIEKNLGALTRLTVTIKTFLDATNIEFGRYDAFKTEERIGEVVARAVNEVMPSAYQKGISLTTAVARGLPRVRIDAGKMQNALINLIDNAIRYTKEGSIVVDIRRKGDELVVLVKDTGVGLTKKDMERIGHLLEKGISAVKLESSGEGLGLYIVKNIVEAHGGRMIVESEGRGKGSQIGFALRLEG